MEPFKFDCPTCHNEISVESKHRGCTIECPHCKESVQVPIYSPNNLRKKRKLKWKFNEKDIRLLFVLKFILFMTSCFYVYQVYYDTKEFSDPSALSKIEGESVKSISPSYGLGGVQEVTTNEHLEASGENTQNILKNTNKLVSLNIAAIKQNDCIIRMLVNIGLALFFLLLSCFIDKIFSVE